MVTSSPRAQPVAHDEFQRRQRGRNIALALTLAGLVVLFFVVSLVKKTTMERAHRAPATPVADR